MRYHARFHSDRSHSGSQSPGGDPMTTPVREIEMCLLGSILLLRDLDRQKEICEMVSPDDFKYSENRLIYESILGLLGRGVSADVASVVVDLGERGLLDGVGGGGYVVAVGNSVPTGLNAVWFAARVREAGYRRRVARAAREVAHYLESGDERAEEAIKRLRGILMEGAVLHLAPKTVSGADLIRGAEMDQRWAVPEVLPEGLTVFAGKPKVGKSFASLSISVAVATGGIVFGKYKCDQGKVLYIALEDSPIRIRRRLMQITDGSENLENLHFAFEWPMLGDGGLGAMEAWLREHSGTRMVVVDTLQRIRGKQDSKVNAYAIDYETLGAIADIARRHRVAVLAVHHTRKSPSDDPIDMVSGSAGITGAADAVWVLRRSRGSNESILTIVGRDIDEQELAMTFNQGLWKVEGTAHEFKTTKERDEILRILREYGPMSPSEIAEMLGARAGTVRVRLLRMLRSGHVQKSGTGQYSITR